MATEPSDATAPPKEMNVEMDVDAEMDDGTQDASTATAATQANNESSSATLDHDFTQSEAQPPTATGAGATSATGGTSGGTGLLHGNRKDVTLREFLSKMDDYAPIVRICFRDIHPLSKTFI